MSDINATNEGAGDAPKETTANGTEVVPAASGEQGTPTLAPGSGPLAKPEGDAAVTAGALLERVRVAAARAFDGGSSDEHNLFAWLHQHLSGAQAILANAERIALTPDGKALAEEVRALL